MGQDIRAFRPTAGHVQFRAELVALLGRHAGHLSPQELLAVAAQVVGQIIACMDQRSLSAEEALEIVHANIVQGNRGALDALIGEPKGRA